MKRRYAFAAIVVITAGGFYVLSVQPHKPPVPTLRADVSEHIAKKASAPPPKPLPDMGVPARFSVPSLDLSAPIEKVGLTAAGDMDVPMSESSLGWYSGGAFPGNAGPAVLAGHTGIPDKPSAFRKLESLRRGDHVQIEDTSGTKASFQIIEIASYTPDTAPRQRIFGPTATARLVIITCSGKWLPAQKTYSHRLVLYSVRTNDVY